MSRLDPVATLKTALVIGAMLGMALFIQSKTYRTLTRPSPAAQHALDLKKRDALINKEAPKAADGNDFAQPGAYPSEIRRRAGLPADDTGLREAIAHARAVHILRDDSDQGIYERAQIMEKALQAIHTLEGERYQVMVWPAENLEQLCRRHPDGEYGCEMYRRDFEAEKPSREKKERAFLEKEKAVVDELRAAYAEFTR